MEKNGKVAINKKERSKLLPMLQDIQQEKGYIPDEDMQDIADKLNIHPVEVYSLVTYYSFLSTKKKGNHIIRISNCISCVMAGSKEIIKQFEKTLKIKIGQTTPDNQFTLEETPCIGMCDEAPAVMVDDELIGKVTAEKVKTIIKEYSE
jgi:NADH:ubiquinone oxidoreductase subunit E